MDKQPISFRTRILRKRDFLPRYIVVKPEHVGGRISAFAADILLNDAEPFRRNIRPWGKGSDVFLANRTADPCERAGLDTNDECTETIDPKG
jgi:hypothetical protein